MVDAFSKRRFNEIEQEVSLGTLDSIIVASIVFFIGLVLALIQSGAINYAKSSAPLLVTLLYISLSIVPILFIFPTYIFSVFNKGSRFFSKIKVLTYISGIVIFDAAVFILVLSADYINSNLVSLPGWVGYLLFLVPLILAILITYFITKKQIIMFFVKEYPSLFLKRLRRISREEKKKVLNAIGQTYSEITNFEKKYY